MSIDKTIDIAENGEDDINKRKPKPFRYVANMDEIQKELETDKTIDLSVMKTSRKTKIKMNEEHLASLENAGKIEDILKKHEEIRRQNMKDADNYSIN